MMSDWPQRTPTRHLLISSAFGSSFFLDSPYLILAETKANSYRSFRLPGIFFTALGWSLWISNRRTIKTSFLMRCFDGDGFQCHRHHTCATAGWWHNCLFKSRFIRDAENKKKGPPTLCSQIGCPAWLRGQKTSFVQCYWKQWARKCSQISSSNHWTSFSYFVLK